MWRRWRTAVITGNTIVNSADQVIVASGNGAHVSLDLATISGGTLKTSGANAVIEATFGATDTLSGVTIAGGSLVEIKDGATLTLSGTISNSGAIEVDPLVASGVLLVGSSSATLTGGGKVSMGGLDALIEAVSSGTTLINVNNTISGAGQVGLGDGDLTLVNSGVVNANRTSALTLDTGSTVANSGTLEATSSGNLVIADNVSNARIIEALGSAATVQIERTITNTSARHHAGLGGTAQIELAGATILGGTLRTSGAGAAIDT